MRSLVTVRGKIGARLKRNASLDKGGILKNVSAKGRNGAHRQTNVKEGKCGTMKHANVATQNAQFTCQKTTKVYAYTQKKLADMQRVLIIGMACGRVKNAAAT